LQQCFENYRKVKDIYYDIKSICNDIKHAVKQVEQDIVPISILGDSTEMDLNQLESSFMYSQLLKEIILDMDYTNESNSVEYNRTKIVYIYT
jgi:hypothetical protein